MKDPTTGELMIENDKLKEASVNYISNLLTNRCPKEDFLEDLILMESLHELWCIESSSSSESITDKDYNTLIRQISF